MSVRRLAVVASFVVVAFAGTRAQQIITTPGAQSAEEQKATEAFAEGAYRLQTPDVEAPILLEYSTAKYTADAMRAKIQGTVRVQVVVGPDGRVKKSRISQSLDKIFGLDEQAVRVAELFVFKPATFKGQPAACMVEIEIFFRLH